MLQHLWFKKTLFEDILGVSPDDSAVIETVVSDVTGTVEAGILDSSIRVCFVIETAAFDVIAAFAAVTGSWVIFFGVAASKNTGSLELVEVMAVPYAELGNFPLDIFSVVAVSNATLFAGVFSVLELVSLKVGFCVTGVVRPLNV